MDDLYEQPTSSAPINSTDIPEDAGQLSDEDDGGPDWTRLSALASSTSTASKPVLAIPKRGDKEFEPAGGIDAGGVGTNLQQHKLERTRAAMFGALDVERMVSSKIASYSVWCSEASRARMLNARGINFSSMGYNVPIDARISPSVKKGEKGQGKVVELLPEEALYLVERGSMFCWSHINGEASDEGTPMTVQQAYSEMVGKEDLTLERYQVYAYLKRLGYTVTRACPPDPYYITAPPFVSRTGETTEAGVFHRISKIFSSPFRWIFGPRAVKIDWWRPLQTSGYVHRFFSYTSLFSSLRLLASGYSMPLPSASPAGQASPYEIFYHLYKPSTPYRKTSPPPPDFFVIVVDGRKTPMPTLHELSALFNQLPELPPPVPRRRLGQAQQTRAPLKTVNPQTPTDVTYLMSLYGRIHGFLRGVFRLGKVVDEKGSTLVAPPRRPNPFQLLKNGKKMIVVAAVDAGMISFFRFCQGAFDEWPMI